MGGFGTVVFAKSYAQAITGGLTASSGAGGAGRVGRGAASIGDSFESAPSSADVDDA
eukprot:COSAG02_NODE_66027_length_256_cov_0.987261_1_plen_56_part_01